MNIVIATHAFSPGTSQAFRDYCQRHHIEHLYIEHRLFGSVMTWSLDVVDVLLRVLFSGKRWDVFFGSNNLNASVGILLLWMKIVKKTVYFSPDYVPKRFNSRLLNWFYHSLDEFCVKHATQSWNSSIVMRVDPIMKSRERAGLSKMYREKQIQLPDGTDPFSQISFQHVDRQSVGFVGHLRKGMGLEKLFNAFVRVNQRYPNAKLILIGSGPLEKWLKKQAKELGVNVVFHGFIGDIRVVYSKLRRCACAVAPYEPNTISMYSDPGKVKNYLSIGLPVVITNVPKIYTEIRSFDCGLVTRYDVDELASAILSMLSDDTLIKRCRKNTKALADKYSWDNIFSSALRQLTA